MKWLLTALSMLLMPYTLDAQIIKGALSFGLHIGADYVLLSNKSPFHHHTQSYAFMSDDTHIKY